MTANILLVEDSDNDRMLMEAAFGIAGLAKPIHVPNGEVAIAYLSGEPPFTNRLVHPLPILVLLDINMPFVNGFQVLKWACATPTIRRIPFVCLTSSLRKQDVTLAYDLRASGYLIKPGAMGDLVKMATGLKEWLEINQFAGTAEIQEISPPC